MTTEVPHLVDWLRWMAEAPPAMRALPEGFEGGAVRVGAVVADLFETLRLEPPSPELLDVWRARDRSARERNRLGYVLAACHVLWHPSLRFAQVERERLEKFLTQELSGLAAIEPVEALETDDERREELVRRVLRAVGHFLPGETRKDNADRLAEVDSVERHRVLKAALEREQRQREVREAMAKKAAEEAACKVSRE